MDIEFQIVYSERFLENFKKLDMESQLVIRSAIRQLAKEPRHPSLRTKRIQGTKSVWEASANMDLRITWQYKEQGVILVRNCGHHDRTLRNP
ncbi:cytotoxin (plasmid) [Alicyclobacillus sp. TC]|uniref:mRNA-degrading endonuclease YafQ of YafQ-DinJ toxin-antitoxin module n=1 Tax=Alicyclobacillus tolerans TaxID=90970 RepID=A0ABT9LYL0_9BACL|nr:mRNA-degrading endonuclease YafQ of YafQ-DinJ toxin-antitoxin module [Alicyclobacillus tengchongensis]QRF24848.1 cytotoxin [Alicyclobacillus sp. TC]